VARALERHAVESVVDARIGTVGRNREAEITERTGALCRDGSLVGAYVRFFAEQAKAPTSLESRCLTSWLNSMPETARPWRVHLNTVLGPAPFDVVPTGALLDLVADLEAPAGLDVVLTAECPELEFLADRTVLVPDRLHAAWVSDALRYRDRGPWRGAVIDHRSCDPHDSRLRRGLTSADPTPMRMPLVTYRGDVSFLLKPPPARPGRAEFPISLPGVPAGRCWWRWRIGGGGGNRTRVLERRTRSSPGAAG